MKLKRVVYKSLSQILGDFFFGFFALYGLFAVISSFLSFVIVIIGSAAVGAAVVPVTFTILVSVMIYFGFTRYWVTLGMLAAIPVAVLIIYFALAIFGLH
jgi:hypothetical protein